MFVLGGDNLWRWWDAPFGVVNQVGGIQQQLQNIHLQVIIHPVKRNRNGR